MTECDHEIQKLAESISQCSTSNTVMIGIRTGGAWVAEHINQTLDVPLPLGILDISFYRDDFTQIGLNPNVQASDIGFDIEGKHIILVDDVLYTGRTIRAALNELFDFGRPAKVTLAVMISRNGQELPIKADIIGKELTLKASQYIRIHGDASSPIHYEIKENL